MRRLELKGKHFEVETAEAFWEILLQIELSLSRDKTKDKEKLQAFLSHENFRLGGPHVLTFTCMFIVAWPCGG